MALAGQQQARSAGLGSVSRDGMTSSSGLVAALSFFLADRYGYRLLISPAWLGA
jgi:hypothetical protein